MPRCYLRVPYAEKEEAKAMGVRWDADRRQWYVTSEESPALLRWGEVELPELFDGEDRSLGGSQLFVDLVPSTCWFTNVRSAVSPTDWERLRHHIYQRAGHACEVCLSPKNLEAHERWIFEENKTQKIQRLKRLITLCSKCHETTHFGLAEIKGHGEQATAHLMKVNKWSRDEAQKHISGAFDLWSRRSKTSWDLDLSMLENSGITIIYPDGGR